MNIGIRVGLLVSSFSLVLASAGHADARWRKASDCLKQATGTDRNGTPRWVWAISCDSAGGGNYKVKYGETFSQGNGESFSWVFKQSGGAAGTSLAVKDGQPYVVAANSTVWYAPQPLANGGVGDLWYSYPTNRCEGGNISLQQVPGDPAIAVGDGGNVYVIEAGGTPSNTLRTWTGSCWQRLPVLPEGSAKEVAIWNAAPGQRYYPWVATTTGNFYRYTGANGWQLVPNGQGYGVALQAVIGLNTAGLWKFVASTGVFTQDTTWLGHDIRQTDGFWVTTVSQGVYHWE